jgi:hypothetical protein
MIRLASLIETYRDRFLGQYGHRLNPAQKNALAALGVCRTALSPRMMISCQDCEMRRYVPHSCGHRHCPHCQAHESQQWIERQLRRRVPADYFLLTFTLPRELRPLARDRSRVVFDALMRSACSPPCDMPVSNRRASCRRNGSSTAGSLAMATRRWSISADTSIAASSPKRTSSVSTTIT